MCPLLLNRHVIKQLLGRKVGWHDLAFFDPVMYESLRQLVLHGETKEDAAVMFTSMDLTFSIELSAEEVRTAAARFLAATRSQTEFVPVG